MFDPFIIKQAYLIHTTLAFLPYFAINPSALQPAWRPLSAFAEHEPNWSPHELEVPHVGRLSDICTSVWDPDDWKFPPQLEPRTFDTRHWRLEWLPAAALPANANPSTSLYVHIYPFGLISVTLATAIGFGKGVDLDAFIGLLRRMMPQKTGADAKPHWLRVQAPDFFAGAEVNLDSLAEVILGQMQRTMFTKLAPDQVVRMQHNADGPYLEGHNGGIVDLVRTDPQQFDRNKDAAAFRGIVSMRSRWRTVGDLNRLRKYRDAIIWTDWQGAWHYAGGINTILWHDSLPEGRGRRARRGFVWRVAAVAELARLEYVLYTYSRDFVVRPAHANLLELRQRPLQTLSSANWPGRLQLKEWARFWLALADAPRVLQTNDLKLAYASHSDNEKAIGTNRARDDFRKALEEYHTALKEYTPLTGRIGQGVKDLAQVISALATISGVVSGFWGLLK